MCTRYVFTDPADMIRDLFRVTDPLPNWPPSYNVAPTHIMPVIRPGDGGRELAMMEWGLIPFFSKDGKRSFTTFNARAEELRSKPMYREPFKTRRCIVPATGYIEFTGPKGDKTAHLFSRTDGHPNSGVAWQRANYDHPCLHGGAIQEDCRSAKMNAS